MTRYTVRVNGTVYEALVDDPPAPVCRVCGHALCPCCTEAGLVSCDTIIRRDEDDEPEFCACGDTECRVDASKVAAFRAEIRRRREITCFGGSGALFAFEETN